VRTSLLRSDKRRSSRIAAPHRVAPRRLAAGGASLPRQWQPALSSLSPSWRRIVVALPTNKSLRMPLRIASSPDSTNVTSLPVKPVTTTKFSAAISCRTGYSVRPDRTTAEGLRKICLPSRPQPRTIGWRSMLIEVNFPPSLRMRVPARPRARLAAWLIHRPWAQGSHMRRVPLDRAMVPAAILPVALPTRATSA